jgi:hypothetical protein
MTARQPEHPRKDGRAERLAAALKANLKRRKAQARGRAVPGDEAPAAPAAEANGRQDGGENR